MITSAPPAKFSERIPEEFRDRAYLKDILAMEDGPEAMTALVKRLDGAEKLVGKKNGIPEDGAPKEAWDEFLTKLRPEKEDGYEFGEKDPFEPELQKALKTAFHTAGLSKMQATRLREKFGEVILARRKAHEAESAKSDLAFEELTKATFGGDKDKVLSEVNALLKEHAPAAAAAHIPRLSDEALIIMAAVISGIAKKFGAEDRVNGGGSNGGGGAGGAGDTEVALKEEGRKLLASEEYRDWRNPKHEDTVKRVKDIYEKLGAKKS